MRLDDLVEAGVAVDRDHVEELLPGQREVLAQAAVDDPALRLEVVLDDLLHAAPAAGAAGACLRGCRRCLLGGRDDVGLGHVVARADHGLVGQPDLDAAATRREDQLLGVVGQLDAAGDHRPQDAVRRGVADQDAAEQAVGPSSATTSFL